LVEILLQKPELKLVFEANFKTFGDVCKMLANELDEEKVKILL
jgi:hypothetical protein